ncbi:MAG: hypothetical protein ABW194_09275 [Novosphingobium sp.]
MAARQAAERSQRTVVGSMGEGAGHKPRLHDKKEHIMLRKFIFALALGGVALTATACNTVKGAGQDLESASQTTEDAINK